jgi:hypothetical protein
MRLFQCVVIASLSQGLQPPFHLTYQCFNTRRIYKFEDDPRWQVCVCLHAAAIFMYITHAPHNTCAPRRQCAYCSCESLSTLRFRLQEFLSRADMSTTSLVQAKARYYQQEVNPNFVPSGMLSPQGLQTDEPVHLSTAGNIPSSPVRLPPAAVPVPHHTAPSTAVPAVAVGATMTGRPVDRTPAGGIADAPLGSSCQGVASTATGIHMCLCLTSDHLILFSGSQHELKVYSLRVTNLASF